MFPVPNFCSNSHATAALSAVLPQRPSPSRLRAFTHHSDERGVFMIWAVFIVPLLIIIAAFAIDIGYHSLILSELKNASDAAAHAAARTLTGTGCPSVSCWQDSRTILLNTLAKHSVHGGGSLDLTTAPEYGDDTVTELSGDNLQIVLKRGLVGDFGAGEEFRSLDEEVTDGNNNVVPLDNGGRPLIVNAVRVTVHRPNTGYFFGQYLGYQTQHLEATSTARLVTGQSANVAPFALAPCTLMKESPQPAFDPNDLHLEDRLFRATDELGGPVFRYRVMLDLDQSRPNPPPCPGICPTAGDGPDRGYRSFNGIVGEPGLAATTKTRILNILNNPSGTASGVYIGQQFAVLPQGLDDAAMFLNRMSTLVFNNPDPLMPLWSQAFNNTYPEPLEKKPSPTCLLNANLIFGGCDGYRALLPTATPNYYFFDPHIDRYFGYSELCGSPTYRAPQPEKTVWHARVPVIETVGQFRDYSCDRYVNPDPNAPPWEWRVVGFAFVDIYDFALGETPWIAGHGTGTCVNIRTRISRDDLFFADTDPSYASAHGVVLMD